jgi:quercetin dioxygenase-like cupin family protein
MTPPGIQVVELETDPLSEGEVIMSRVSSGATDTIGLNMTVVRFPRGVRRPWSTHAQDQYAWIVSGKGVIASEEGEIELHPGALVFIPANTKHQHGASEEAGMTQLSIIGGIEPRRARIAL